MKVNSNWAFDENYGELIDFVDLGDSDIDFATLEKENIQQPMHSYFSFQTLQLSENMIWLILPQL